MGVGIKHTLFVVPSASAATSNNLCDTLMSKFSLVFLVITQEAAVALLRKKCGLK